MLLIIIRHHHMSCIYVRAGSDMSMQRMEKITVTQWMETYFSVAQWMEQIFTVTQWMEQIEKYRNAMDGTNFTVAQWMEYFSPSIALR